jgi:hypothetical protein
MITLVVAVDRFSGAIPFRFCPNTGLAELDMAPLLIMEEIHALPDSLFRLRK